MTLGCVYCSYGSWDLFREAYAAIEVSPELGAGPLHREHFGVWNLSLKEWGWYHLHARDLRV